MLSDTGVLPVKSSGGYSFVVDCGVSKPVPALEEKEDKKKKGYR